MKKIREKLIFKKMFKNNLVAASKEAFGIKKYFHMYDKSSSTSSSIIITFISGTVKDYAKRKSFKMIFMACFCERFLS